MASTALARGQTAEEVLDRNLAELLQEMRVAITGVQILFAFLLNRWAAVILTVLAGAWFLTFWAALPFARRNWGEDDDLVAVESYQQVTGPAR